MARDEQEKWQAKYASLGEDPLPDQVPALWLQRWGNIIPQGRIVDLAVGLGANALYLASQGFWVVGIDVSEKAIMALHRTALARKLQMQLIVADLDIFPLPVEHFDAVLSFLYLNRRLFPQMKKSLKPGGILIMETFVNDPEQPEANQPTHRLSSNELLRAFADLEVLDYVEGRCPRILDAPEPRAATARICARRVDSSRR